MKKLGFGLLALVVLMLSGCTSKAPETGENQDEIVLEFWTLQLLNFKDTLTPMFEAYEKQHPGVRIKWVDVPFSEGEKRTLTAMLSPKMPDVVNLNPDFSAILASRKAVVDMNEAVPAEVRKTYLPVAWEACTFQDQSGADIAFGVPWYITSRVTLYNRELLRQSGVKALPSTTAEIEPFAKVLREKNLGYAMMPALSDHGSFLKMLAKEGIPLFDEKGRAVFADHGAGDYLEIWVRMYRNKLIPAEALTEGHRVAVDRYQAGTLAMLLTGPNFLNIVAENSPAVFKQTDVRPQFPEGGGGAPDFSAIDFSTMVLIVPRGSKHPKEAVDFALFMTNAANQLAFSEAAPVLPSVTEALETPYFNQPTSPDLLVRARSISAQQLVHAKKAYRIRSQQGAINEIMDHDVQLALLGKLSPQAAMQKAQDEINKLY